MALDANSWTEELMGIIELLGGLAGSAGNLKQAAAAIQQYVANNAIGATETVFTASGHLRGAGRQVPGRRRGDRGRVVAGGAGSATPYGGGSGAAGGYARRIVAVTPGRSSRSSWAPRVRVRCMAARWRAMAAVSSFGSATPVSATGGFGGATAVLYAFGGAPGMGFGGSRNLGGGYGADGNGGGAPLGGLGGASFWGGGGRASTAGGSVQQTGIAWGSGGGACYGTNGNGGNGAPGSVVVRC